MQRFRILFILVIMAFITLLTHGQHQKKTSYKPPPEIVTLEEFTQWVVEAVEKTHPGMDLKIVDTDEWAGYINQTPEAPLKHYMTKECLSTL